MVTCTSGFKQGERVFLPVVSLANSIKIGSLRSNAEDIPGEKQTFMGKWKLICRPSLQQI